MPLHLKTGVGDLALITETGVVPNSDPCQIITPLVLVGLGLGVGEGLGLGNHIEISNERGNNLAGGRKWAQHPALLTRCA